MNVAASFARDTVKKGRAGTHKAVILATVMASMSIVACAPTTRNTATVADRTADTVASSETLAPNTVASTETADASSSSRLLVAQSGDAPGLELTDGSQINKVLVRADLKAGDYNVERVASPDRIVIDLYKGSAHLNRVFNTEDSGLVSKIRLGAHADKSRIVLDLNQGTPITHTVALTPEGLAVILTTDVATTDKEVMAAPKLEKLPVSQGMEAKNLESSAIEPLAIIAGLNLEAIDNLGTALVVDINTPGFFSLKRSAPSEYVLTMENAMLDQAASTTLLAPPNATSIRSVRPVVQGNNVLMRIFTTPQVTLAANIRSGKIVVAPTSGSDAFAAEIKAQAAPGKTDKVVTDTATAKPVVVSDTPVKPVVAADDSEISALLRDTPTYTGRLISLDLQDTDIDNALRIIAEVSNLNIIASDDVTGKVTLRLIDVPWDQALDVILKTNGLDKVQEGNVVRIAPVEKLRQERESLKQAQQAEEELEPLAVRYIRVSYGKASELKPLVETVLSERGTVTYDERTNQIIVKDIRKGIRNVAELVTKIDLRTPQVLLETQIIEARRNLLRDLGAQLGFQYIRSPATGNATGYNFPNSVNVGGGLPGGAASSFPAAVSDTAGSAINMLFGSADGTKSLEAEISALEQEGRIRVVSRPAVATTNNKPALIKSVEKIRVKTPSGGTSVATGQGASASGSSAVATESIEIGIQLDVTPQASPDYYVLLDVKAKSSTFGSRVVEGIPSEVERSANSTVLVSSGQTFAMGGIYKITDSDSVSGVPFFKDIPFFGALFRDQRVDNADEELLFFITPRIIEGSFDDAAMKAAS